MNYSYSVTPLHVDHIDELCDDLQDLHKKGISIPIFMFKLNPEGRPPIDKLTPQINMYMQFKERLDALGVPSGILIQSTLGHDAPLNEPISFQPIINLNSGEETFVACPADERFKEYFKNACREIAKCHPCVIMLDDDCRLLNRPGKGCACPLHMAEFNRRTGLNMTREELWDYIQSHPENDPVTNIFTDTQRDSLHSAIVAMREGIDEIDPSIQGINCTSGPMCEFVAENNKVFAGKGNPRIVRAPIGTYAPENMRGFSDIVFRSARTITKLKRDGIDIVLAEMDAIPYNRYGKSATVLHAQLTTDILDGCCGAKHWFTRLICHEPDSGKAYRKVLADHMGMYEKLMEIAPKIKWLGPNVPFEVPEGFAYHRKEVYGWSVDNWSFSKFFLERVGIPYFHSDEIFTTSFLSDPIDRFTSDALEKIFSGNVILTSGCVQQLIERGFGEYLGVSTREWNGVNISGEELSNGGRMQKQVNILELVPEKENVIIDSVAYHVKNDTERVPLFPSTTIYKRPDGKTTITFAGTPESPFYYTVAFSFLNESRKKQIVKLLSDLGELPVYYSGDSEILLRAGSISDNEILIAPFELGWDVLENLPLHVDNDVINVKRMNGAGELIDCPFTKNGNDIVIKCPIKPIHPEVFIIKTK